MGRRGSHMCAVRYPDARGVDGSWVWGVTWCGKPHGGSSLSGKPEDEDHLAFARRMADCPKCSAAIGKVRLKQIADRVQIEPMEIPSNSWGKKYKSCHRVIIDGVLAAHIVMDNGWGTVWELRQLTDDDGRDFGSLLSREPNRYHRIERTSDFQPVHVRSKEMMASAALRLRDKGELLNLAEQEAFRIARREKEAEDARLRKIEQEQWKVEREARDARENERKELAVDWLTAVLNEPNLTNMQRAGAQASLDIITGKRV